MWDTVEATSVISKIETSEEIAFKRIDIAKGVFEKIVARTNMSTVVTASHTQTSKVIRIRITESIGDFQRRAETVRKRK
ncbi:MAG: hypothetical protein CBB68_14925 [Rhodospirillaceae bacterium TMED8]|nr:hypothetical protein [Magnetovibrio sp.]OUT47723.1 MAG: hypothetical protein CBB68_14925 [Rhodospirillaceae bacterium TMED8]